MAQKLVFHFVSGETLDYALPEEVKEGDIEKVREMYNMAESFINVGNNIVALDKLTFMSVVETE